jgi:hypothetical protein
MNVAGIACLAAVGDGPRQAYPTGSLGAAQAAASSIVVCRRGLRWSQ